MSYTPHLFIGIGETSAFFTLRETYLHEEWVGGQGGYMNREVRSFHHFNLSQDAAEAVAKAQVHAETLGLEMTSTVDSLQTEMRDIRRATAEELVARERAREAQAALWAAERAERAAERLSILQDGLVSFGAHSGKRFEQLDPSYIGWVVDNIENFEADSLLRAMAEVILSKFAHLIPRKPDPELLLGTEGLRRDFEVEVLRVFKFLRPKFSAHWLTETVYIVTMISKEGACVVSKGTSFAAEVGETFRMKATIKGHDSYNGQAQTIVQRIKVLPV